MRAMLTTLGIIIGVGAVIAMMGIGKGSSTAIQRTISSMGANNLLIHPGTAASGGVSFGAGSVMTLTPQDCEAILRECPAVRSAAPDVNARTQVIYGNRNWVPLFINGTTPAFLDVRNFTLAEGEMFSERDIRNASKVCVLGQTLVKELFGNESPLGKEVRVRNVLFRVIGVLSAKGANMTGMNQDDILLAPWTTIKYRVAGSTLTNVNQSSSATGTSSGSGTGSAVNSLSQLYPTAKLNLYPLPSATQAANTPLPVRFTNVDHILVSAHSAGEIPLAIMQITSLLRERHRLHPGEADDFNIRDMTEQTRALASTSTLMTNLLLSVALISLIVGGVGYHEHHARVRDRADPGDRPAHVGGRAGAGHPAAVFGRSRGTVPCWRCSRDIAWLRRLIPGDTAAAVADGDVNHRYSDVSHRFRRCGHYIWILPGVEGFAPGPD